MYKLQNSSAMLLGMARRMAHGIVGVIAQGMALGMARGMAEGIVRVIAWGMAQEWLRELFE